MKFSWIKNYKELPWDRRLLWGAAGLSLIPLTFALLSGQAKEPSSDDKVEQQRISLDTNIPRGFVLVPIEVQNYEALNSILGHYGVVDLFHGQRLKAKNVKILRAPHNPSQFAILVAENQVGNILQDGSAFAVTVKRPDEGGTEFVNADNKDTNNKPKRHRIIYGGVEP